MKLALPAFAHRRPEPRDGQAGARLRVSTEWVTGIARGREGVTVVTLEHRGEILTLRALAREPVPAEAPDAEVSAAIRTAIAEARRQAGRLGRVVAAMPSRSTVIRQAQFPRLQQNELVAAIQGEARRHIPLDLREAGLDFQVLAQDRQQLQTRVVLVAAPRRALHDQVELLARAGVEPWVMDTKPMASINALFRQRPLAPDEALGLLEVSAHGATLTLVTCDGYLLTRGVGLGPAERATAPAPAADATADLERLAQDVRRSLTFFQQVIGHRATVRLAVIGAVARRAEATAYLESVLGLACESPDPLACLERAPGLVLPEDPAGATVQDTLVAVGLALRTSQPVGPLAPTFRVNLYMERGRRLQRERRRLLSVMGSSALVMVNALALTFLLIATHALQGYVKADAADVQGLKQQAQRLIAASGSNGPARHTLDLARTARPVWSPALAGVVGAQPAGLSLTAVTFVGGLPNAPDDTSSATLTIRGVVERSGSDPYAGVTEYVEALRQAPAVQRAFPAVHLSNTWENRESGTVSRNFEIVCAKQEGVR